MLYGYRVKAQLEGATGSVHLQVTRPYGDAGERTVTSTVQLMPDSPLFAPIMDLLGQVQDALRKEGEKATRRAAIEAEAIAMQKGEM